MTGSSHSQQSTCHWSGSTARSHCSAFSWALCGQHSLDGCPSNLAQLGLPCQQQPSSRLCPLEGWNGLTFHSSQIGSQLITSSNCCQSALAWLQPCEGRQLSFWTCRRIPEDLQGKSPQRCLSNTMWIASLLHDTARCGGVPRMELSKHLQGPCCPSSPLLRYSSIGEYLHLRCPQDFMYAAGRLLLPDFHDNSSLAMQAAHACRRWIAVVWHDGRALCRIFSCCTGRASHTAPHSRHLQTYLSASMLSASQHLVHGS